MPTTVPVAGTQLLQYRVIERLGAGGMGEVFLAEDTRLGRQVALKFLSAADAHDGEARARLVREARAASVLRSPHVAVTYDLVENGADVFIAMEYVEGELLSDRVARGPLPVPEALDIAMQVADALDEAHGQGIVHRDIKSANVILTRRHLVKVLDFGLAKFLNPQPEAAVTGVTLPGLVLGTLNYMAPEQLRGAEVDHRVDLFAVGAVLYEMLTGRPPFQAATMADTANRILTQEPEALARFNYSVPADVEAVVRKALAKDPAFRYQSARELWVDLNYARERLVRDSTSGRGARFGALIPPVGFGQSPLTAPPTPAARERTVAVLTFANLTGNPLDEWVGQGIAESLTADFAKVHGLKVIPRDQMFDVQRELSDAQGRIVDERQSIELGRRLGATWVVSGAVQRLGDRVRLTAQTIAVDEGRSVSTVKLDGAMDQIFELQDKLVEELVRQGLQRELQQSEKLAIGDDARSPEAYEAYSRGIQNLRTATEESTERAIALFERALALDPEYIEALIALGNALQLRGSFLAMPHVLERSKALLEKAVALAPDNVEAHVRLGQTLATLGQVDAAEAAVRRGLALEPDNAVAHGQLARVLWLGRAQIPEAIRHFARSAELAPQAGYTYLQLALLEALSGNLDAAERYAREAVDLQQRAMSGTQGLIVIGAHTRLGYIHYLRGQYEEAIREYRRELNFLSVTDHALRDRSIIEVSQKLAVAYQRLGSADEARTFGDGAIDAFNHRLASGADDPFTRYYVAALYAMRDDVEPVLTHLASPLRALGAFTRWRLPRDPDFAGVLGNPAVAAAIAAQ